jgi:hypothetical protein
MAVSTSFSIEARLPWTISRTTGSTGADPLLMRLSPSRAEAE